LSAQETREMEPALLSGLTGGVHYPEDAHLNPSAFVRGLARRLFNKGVAIQEQTGVTGFTSQGKSIKSVSTTKGDFHPKKVLVAAGAWSTEILNFVNKRVPIQPAKGFSITLEKPDLCPKIPLYLGESKVALTPLEKALRLGGTLELAGMDLTINRRRVEAIKSAAKEYLGSVEGMDKGDVWAGLRPCTPDGLPIISPVTGYSNLFVAAGHGMLGISLAPITGKLVSQMLTEKIPDIDLAPLSLDRF